MMFHIHFEIFQCDLDMLYVTSQFIGVVLSSHILMQKYNIDFYQVATRLSVVYMYVFYTLIPVFLITTNIA